MKINHTKVEANPEATPKAMPRSSSAGRDARPVTSCIKLTWSLSYTSAKSIGYPRITMVWYCAMMSRIPS